MAENGNGNGFEAHAGPAWVKASGSTVINVLLAILLLTATFYMIYTINQQTIMIQNDHSLMQNSMNSYMTQRSQEHMTMISEFIDLKNENRKMFLSSILTNKQKEALSPEIQEKAKQIIERKADETIKKIP